MSCKNDSDWNTILEPQSESNLDTRPLYPYNNISYTESGHLFEMDDTPGRERIRLQHRSNTFIEMHSDGTEVHKIWGDGYEIVLCNKKVLVKGSCTIAVDGNAAIEVKGNAWNTVKGNYVSHIEGNGTINSKKSLYLTAENEISMAADSITFKADQINNIGDIQLQGDLSLNETTTVQGNITATGAIIGIKGLLTPGSLVVGPLAATMPQEALLASFVDIDVLTYVSMKAGVTISGIALGAILFNAGADFTASAVGAAEVMAQGEALLYSSVSAQVVSPATAIVGEMSAIVSSPVLVSLAAPAITMTGATIQAQGIVNVSGLLNVTGLTTALDFISLIDPTPYSIHGHAPLALTPPVPI